MVILAGILMLALAVLVVAYPLFQPPTAPSQPVGVSFDEDLAELLTCRDATYVALKELDLDHEMGKTTACRGSGLIFSLSNTPGWWGNRR